MWNLLRRSAHEGPSVGGLSDAAAIHHAVDGVHGVTRVMDMLSFALAVAVALALERPHEADRFIVVTRYLDVMSFTHGRDGVMSAGAEASLERCRRW